MSDREKFELEPEEPAGGGGGRNNETGKTSQSQAQKHDMPLAVEDIPDGGSQLAAAMEAADYQPVILFGTAASGKTSLLLSLLAIARTETSLDTGVFLADPILRPDSAYGRYLIENAEEFFGRKTQEFIEHRAPASSKIALPFFVPIAFRPRLGREVKFAFMESNGEWYRPDRDSSRLFKRLKGQVEDFISQYQGGIIFIHLVPYTQRPVYGAQPDPADDASLINEASLAISGALQAYENVRVNKRNDRHIMLVTKWDAHRPSDADRIDMLSGDKEEVEAIVNERYAAAFNSYRGLSLESSQLQLNCYISGLMNQQGTVGLRKDDELRSTVISYPINLWRWLYKSALTNIGEMGKDPFPMTEMGSPIGRTLKAFLDKLFR
jgi:hypothetical protein